MIKHFPFYPYTGNEDFPAILCTNDCEEEVSAVACALIERGFNVYFNADNGRYSQSCKEVAQSINKSKSVIAIISENGAESLTFRNEINYALSLSKKMICIKLGNFELKHGLDMQLSNIKMIGHESYEKTINELLSSPVLTQTMIGGKMEKRSFNTRRNVIIAAMTAAAVIAFAVSASFIVKNRTSAEFKLKDADGIEYLSLAPYGDEGIKAMAGKNVEILDLSGGEYKSLYGIENIRAKEVDVSGIDIKTSLWPISRMEGIETVKIDQDQIIYAKDLYDSGICVVVEK